MTLNKGEGQTERTDCGWLPRLRDRGKDWEFGISRCKLLYIGWINSNVLLYSTGKYIQFPVQWIIEKDMRNKVSVYIIDISFHTHTHTHTHTYIYIHIYLNHFAV